MDRALLITKLKAAIIWNWSQYVFLILRKCGLYVYHPLFRAIDKSIPLGPYTRRLEYGSTYYKKASDIRTWVYVLIHSLYCIMYPAKCIVECYECWCRYCSWCYKYSTLALVYTVNVMYQTWNSFGISVLPFGVHCQQKVLLHFGRWKWLWMIYFPLLW